jgi:hypothetical protein
VATATTAIATTVTEIEVRVQIVGHAPMASHVQNAHHAPRQKFGQSANPGQKAVKPAPTVDQGPTVDLVPKVKSVQKELQLLLNREAKAAPTAITIVIVIAEDHRVVLGPIPPTLPHEKAVLDSTFKWRPAAILRR